MTGSDGAAYSGTRSPEEVAEYDREIEEVKRKLFGQTDMDIERYIDQGIEHDIEQGIEQDIIDEMFYAID